MFITFTPTGIWTLTLSQTPHKFVAVSPLAEGADRLVAKEIMEWQASENTSILEAVLPLPEGEYEKDFETQKSRNEFRELLAIAKIVPPPKNAESRDAAYKQAGLYVVDNCDVLIAIWNGKPAAGKGGTAEIVEYASNAGRSIFWINSENNRIKENRNVGMKTIRLNPLNISTAYFNVPGTDSLTAYTRALNKQGSSQQDATTIINLPIFYARA